MWTVSVTAPPSIPAQEFRNSQTDSGKLSGKFWFLPHSGALCRSLSAELALRTAKHVRTTQQKRRSSTLENKHWRICQDKDGEWLHDKVLQTLWPSYFQKSFVLRRKAASFQPVNSRLPEVAEAHLQDESHLLPEKAQGKDGGRVGLG